MRTTIATIALLCALPAAASAQTLGSWNFEEGGVSGYGEAHPHVLDSSDFENHGFIPGANYRVDYVNDAHEGDWAIELNNPNDPRPFAGQINFPHSYSLEPARGEVSAAIKVDSFHDATIFTKSTFQWLQTEPASQPPVLIAPGTSSQFPLGRIIGRTVYSLELLNDGRIRATVGNDDPNEATPWVSVVSEVPIALSKWSEVGMAWDGCTLSVTVEGGSNGRSYTATPIRGLSYQGTGTDPAFGAADLDASISQAGAPFVGKVDAVSFRELECTGCRS